MNENGIWCQNGIPFLAPYSAKTEPVLAPYSAKTELRFWHHMVPHGASWCQKVPKRGTRMYGTKKTNNNIVLSLRQVVTGIP